MEPSIRVSEVMAAEKEVEPSLPVLKTVSPETSIRSQEDTETPTVEPTLAIPREDVDPDVEDPLSRM